MSENDIPVMNITIGIVVLPPAIYSSWSLDRPGFLVELAVLMCNSFNFTCRLDEPQYQPNSFYANNTWNAMMEHIHNKTYDTAVPYFSPTPERLALVDFSKPLLYIPIVFITRAPPVSELSLSRLMTLHWSVWLCLLTAAFITGLILTASEWPVLNSRFVRLSFLKWFDSISLLLNQPQESNLVTLSGRLLIAFWAMSALIVSAVYSGNLLAFLMKNKVDYPFTNFETFVDCIETGQCQLASRSMSNSYISQLYNPQVKRYHRLQHALTQNKILIVPSGPELLQQILKTKTRYIVWMSLQISFLYETNGNPYCKFMTIPTGMNDELHFPVQKGAGRLAKAMNTFIDDIQFSGLQSRIYNKYIKLDDECKKIGDPTEGTPLPVSAVYSLLFVLLVGCLISFISFLIEKLHNYKRWGKFEVKKYI